MHIIILENFLEKNDMEEPSSKYDYKSDEKENAISFSPTKNHIMMMMTTTTMKLKR